MRINDNEFPVVVQAFDTTDSEDRFVAEQVVSNQTEIDSFTSRYAGKLIKVKVMNADELKHDHRNVVTRRKTSSGTGVWIFLLLVLAALVIAGFATGWIQRTFGLNLNF
jgi:cobalamin biosynthesis Mg chelatase CobN